MSFPFVMNDNKELLFSLLSENNIDAAKELILSSKDSKRYTLFSDAGFFALAINKPELVDFLFENLDILEEAPLPELFKMATFATQPDHYSAFAKATKGKRSVGNGGFITDTFTAATWNDNAQFLTWLLENDYTPRDNYHTDSAHTWTLLDIVGNATLHKCELLLITHNFKPTSFKRMKVNSFLYPWPEEVLNSTEIWIHMIKWMHEEYVHEGFFSIAANWFSKMAKSESNTQHAALALLQKHCTGLEIPTADNVDIARTIAHEKGRMKEYLEKLSAHPFTHLFDYDVAIHLFFNAPLLEDPSDIEYAIDMLESAGHALGFDPLSNNVYCFALKNQTHLKARLKEIQAMPFVKLKPSLQTLLNKMDDDYALDSKECDDLDSPMFDEFEFLDTEPEKSSEDGSEEHF